MAPSPDQHNEPKAPDKSDNKVNKISAGDIQKHDTRTKNNSKINSTDSQDKKVSALDDGQLRELLEEAVSYKCPKDRVGKSSLFVELLQRAEADERNQRATNASGSQVVRHYNTAYSQRNRNKQSKETSAAERNSHGGSLQNLYQVNDHTTSRKTRKKTSVSARQREGGSLPSCNIVPVDKITFEKPANCKMETSHVQAVHALSTIKPEYTTIDLSNAEPEETQSLIENDALNNHHDNDLEMKVFSNDDKSNINNSIAISNNGGNGGSGGAGSNVSGSDFDVIQAIPRINMQYTSRASLEISDSRKSNSDVDTNVVFSVLKEYDQRKATNGLETTPLELQSNYSSVKCIMEGPAESVVGGRTRVVPKEVSTASTHLSMLSIPHQLFLSDTRIRGLKDNTDKKTFDENGNTVNTFNSSLSSQNETRKSKKTKPKTDRNVTISKPESFKGFCGDKDVDSLVKFIEATTNNNNNNNNDKHHKNNKHVVNNVNAKTHKNVTNFGKDENERNSSTGGGGKKRSTERRSSNKDKNEKLKKSNSLEEISKTKLEDLTTENKSSENVPLRRTAKKQATFDDVVFTEPKGDRRSWGTEEGQQYYCNDNTDFDKQKRKDSKTGSTKTTASATIVKPDIINTNPHDIMSIDSLGSVESADFHVVTKKRKSKKRRSTSGGRSNLFNEDNRRNNYYQRDNPNKFTAHDHCDNDILYLNNFQNTSPDHRRKSTCSMPPSDKSNDSSDLDSVHSLPVESTSTKMCIQQVSTSSGGTPQASYADIAKMANVHTASTYSTNYGIVDIKNADKWPAVSHNSKQQQSSLSVTSSVTPSTLSINKSSVMSVKNYNFPDLIIDNCNENCNYYSFDRMFTTVSEIEAKHLSEAKNNFKLKNGGGKTDAATSPPNSRILQDQYPALEKTLPIKNDVKNNKKIEKSNISYNKSKLKNNSNNSEVPTTVTKGCDIDKKLSNATTNTTSQEYQDNVVQPNSRQQTINNINHNLNNNHNSNNQTSQKKSKKHHQQQSSGGAHHHTIGSGGVCSRPAVIILNDTEKNSSNSSDITFGFDINEKLLLDCELNDNNNINPVLVNGDYICGGGGGGGGVVGDDFIVPTSAVSKCASPTATIEPDTVSSASCNSIVTVVEDFTARFVTPPKLEETIHFNHDKIVNFVESAWEDIINQQNGGKVQYYSGK